MFQACAIMGAGSLGLMDSRMFKMAASMLMVAMRPRDAKEESLSYNPMTLKNLKLVLLYIGLDMRNN